MRFMYVIHLPSLETVYEFLRVTTVSYALRSIGEGGLQLYASLRVTTVSYALRSLGEGGQSFFYRKG